MAFSGSEGNKKMKDITSSLRNNPFITLNGHKVVRVEDYLQQKAYENGKTEEISLPKSDVIKLYFDDTSSIAVRPSGTEPKIKFYVGAVDPDKKEAKEKPGKYYQALKDLLKL